MSHALLASSMRQNSCWQFVHVQCSHYDKGNVILFIAGHMTRPRGVFFQNSASASSAFYLCWSGIHQWHDKSESDELRNLRYAKSKVALREAAGEVQMSRRSFESHLDGRRRSTSSFSVMSPLTAEIIWVVLLYAFARCSFIWTISLPLLHHEEKQTERRMYLRPAKACIRSNLIIRESESLGFNLRGPTGYWHTHVL